MAVYILKFLQLVSDPSYRVINCVARWPGSVHDSRILRNSGLFAQFESNRPPLQGKNCINMISDLAFIRKTYNILNENGLTLTNLQYFSIIKLIKQVKSHISREIIYFINRNVNIKKQAQRQATAGRSRHKSHGVIQY